MTVLLLLLVLVSFDWFDGEETKEEEQERNTAAWLPHYQVVHYWSTTFIEEQQAKANERKTAAQLGQTSKRQHRRKKQAACSRVNKVDEGFNTRIQTKTVKCNDIDAGAQLQTLHYHIPHNKLLPLLLLPLSTQLHRLCVCIQPCNLYLATNPTTSGPEPGGKKRKRNYKESKLRRETSVRVASLYCTPHEQDPYHRTIFLAPLLNLQL